MFETIICAVQLAIKKKEGEKCVKWNGRKTENGLKNRAVITEGVVAPSRGYFTLWSCLTDCGMMEESRERGAKGVNVDSGAGLGGYSIPDVESPGEEFNKSSGTPWDLTSHETLSPFAKESNYNSPACQTSNCETDVKNVHYYKQNYSNNKYIMVGDNFQD
jgi:hypothetical protein